MVPPWLRGFMCDESLTPNPTDHCTLCLRDWVQVSGRCPSPRTATARLGAADARRRVLFTGYIERRVVSDGLSPEFFTLPTRWPGNSVASGRPDSLPSRSQRRFAAF